MTGVFRRFRLFAAGLALISSLGVVPAGASAATSARISAHLTSTSFTAAQAGSVQVVYRFSSRSTRFAYVLSRRAGSAWSTMRSVSRRGSFRGSHTMTIKSAFGSRPITAGRYRIKLSSSANSVTLSFTLASPEAVKPEAGQWVATALSGPVSGDGAGSFLGFHVTATGISFTVAPGGAAVTGFGFTYDMLGPGTTPGTRCTQSDSTADQTPAPITNQQFSTPAQNAWTDPYSYGTFSGTFDSPTSAHGTAWVRGWIGIFLCSRPGYANTGIFSWTATRQHS